MKQSNLTQVSQAYEQLQQQNEELQKKLSASRTNTDAREVNPEQRQVSVPPQQARVKPGLSVHESVVERNRLTWADTKVTAAPEGLVATMQLMSTKSGPLGLLALAFRMSRGSDARLISVEPVGGAIYTDSSNTVSEDGKFAFFQGTLGDEKDVRFALTVSAPATVSVRGTCGLKPCELDIKVAAE